MNNMENSSAIILSSEITFKRNLKNYPFVFKMTPAQKSELLSGMVKYVKARAHLTPFVFNFLETAFLEEDELHLLNEKGFISKNVINEKEGKGIFLTKDNKVLLVINDKEHITIKVTEYGSNTDNAYKTALNLDDLICDELPLAFSEKYGYLYSDIYSVGTGVDVKIKMHLPALDSTGEIYGYSESMKNFGIEIKKISEGSIFSLRNRLSFGLSEKESIENLEKVASTLATEESKRQDDLITDRLVLENMILAVETLKDAMEIDYNTLLELFSLVRVGINKKLIFGIDSNELMKYSEILGEAAIKENYKTEATGKRRAKLVKSLFEKVYY